jgi:two-component system LytT family sensor kinase
MKKSKIIIALAAALLFTILFSVLYKWLQTGNPFQAETIMFGSIIFLNIIITGGVGYNILGRFSHKSTIQTRRKIIPAFMIFVLIALVVSLSTISLGVYLFYLAEGLNTSNFLKHLFTIELSSAIKQFIVWILLASAVFFYTIWRKAVAREQQLREENLRYRYRNLKSQVNPHFLFNSLNTLSEIVYDDAKKADSYIQRLSAIYRYILDNEETDLIPLREELDFVEKYFSLQKERDNGKISLKIDIKDADRYRIIPVSLQLLVENALKHNSISLEKPLEVHIYNTDEHVVVSNTLQRKSIIENSTHTGLSNLRERVKLIMNKEIIVEEKNNRFNVKLPLLEEEK